MTKVYKPLFFLSFITLFFCILFANSSPVHAEKTINKSQAKAVATFKTPIDQTQGAIITSKYYVYSDCSGHCATKFNIYVVDRQSCKLVKKKKMKAKNISGFYNEWGTQKITIIKTGKKVGCVEISGDNVVKSKSCKTPKGAELGRDSQGRAMDQGAPTLFNNYRFKTGGWDGTHIGVFKEGSTRPFVEYLLKDSFGEPEDISIDGDTGEVYVAYQKFKNGNQKKKVIFAKIDASVFKEYTGKDEESNPTICKNFSQSGSSSSSSDSNNRGKNPYINRKPDNPISSIASEAINDGVVETNFFGELQDDGKGCGVWLILNLILTILTFGIVLAATIGMLISAITYMTASDNPEKIIKAKKRILDIIIGLFIYAAMWSILQWLLPGGVMNTGEICQSVSSTSGTSSNNTSSTGKT